MKLPTEEGMREILEEYFNECIKKEQIPTKNGMTLALNITRETYNQWKKKSDTLKEYEKLTEETWVQRLTKNNVAGIIFYLKNAFGYRDRQDLDVTTKGKELSYTNDQIKTIAKRTINDDSDKGKESLN
uniref:Putative terminase small subunit n=1 Tax=viral metagenome TaxID=1070528 RepID=A0A6H1ZYG2_9ZZZZ